MAHVPDSKNMPVFPGFPAFQSNVTYVPIQFFTVVLPNASRGTARVVGYALRKVLGYVDEKGVPKCAQLQFSYRELAGCAGLTRDTVTAALKEAVQMGFLRCVQTMRPDQKGRCGQSAIYEICWDMEGPYTNKLSEFKGFFYGPAAVMDEADGTVPPHFPRAARKNIPNAFFDFLLRRERLSVIRVVGALLFYSIQWGLGGERRGPVCRSITELSRLAHLSRQHVHGAVLEAQRRGYIEPVIPGIFDPRAGQQSQATTYGIRWIGGPVTAVELGDPKIPTGTLLRAPPDRPAPPETGDWPEKVNGTLARPQSYVDRPKKVNGNRPEKVNGISIKMSIKTETTTTTMSGCKPEAVCSAAAVDSVEALLRAGFDQGTAKHLAGNYPLEVIQRQIAWLPLRSASRNRLGLLRRAIEGDYQKPEGGVATSALPTTSPEPARLFTSHYYAGYHGHTEPAATEPLPKDLMVAGQFLAGLLEAGGNASLIPEWGRQFGRLMRARHQNDPKAKPNLAYALPVFGGQFLSQMQAEAAARRKKALGAAKERHQAAFYPRYEDYLRQSKSAVQKANPELYREFLESREATRKRLKGGLILASAQTLTQFETESYRLHSLAGFLASDPVCRVLDFWEWDRRLNPQGFGSNQPAKPASSPEAHP